MSAQPEPQESPKDPIPENAKPISEIINDFLSRLDDPNFDPLKMPWPKQCCAVCAKPLDHSPEPVLVHAGSGIMFCSEKCVEYFRKNFAEFYKEHNFHYNPNDPFFRFSFDPDDWVEVMPCQCGAIPVVTQNTVAKIKCPECGCSVGANPISLQTLALGWNNLKDYADHAMDQLREANEREPKLWTLHLDPIKPLGDVTCETTPHSHATSFSSLFSKTSPDSPAPDPLSTQVGGDHYAQFPYQPIQFFHDRHLDAFQANIIKYLARWRSKNGLEDLKKAEHYLLVAELNQAHDLEQTAIFLEQFQEEERAIMDLALCNYFGTARQKLHELIERLEAEQTETEAEKEDQQMAKYSVKVRKYFDLQIPVEGYDPNEIRQRIWKLIDKGDMEVIFGDIHDKAWGYDIRFVRKISFEEFEDLADCTEVVHWDGTHSWRE